MRAACVLLSLVIAGACGGSRPPEPSPGGGSPETITGRERLGWDQRAGDDVELSTFRYAVYVDGVRTELTDARCSGPASANGFPCDARLPAMSVGSHTLELVSFAIDDPTLESSRSQPIRLTVAGGAVTTGSIVSGEERTASGARLLVTPIAAGLQDVTDAAVSPDGRVFITERQGAIRVVEQDRLAPEPAIVIDEVAADPRAAILAIALDPEFTSSRLIFVLFTAPDRDGALTFHLARYRELQNRLAQRAIIVDRVPATEDATGSIRIGPDRRLYVAISATPGTPAGTPDGSVLRLNADGTTPKDQPAATPVLIENVPQPRALTWDPGSRLMWLAEEAGNEPDRVSAFAVASGPPVRVERRTVQQLRDRPSSMTLVGGDLFPAWTGNLLIASDAGAAITRAALEDGDPSRIAGVEHLLRGRAGPIRVVVMGTDGAIYFCTPDALGRITPAATGR